jgi:peptidoglycan/LPS O-acetylase OafA/YrhL
MGERLSPWDRGLDGGHNALDAIRLALASLVVFEHSFFLVDSSVSRDPLHVLSGGQMHFGQFAVFMFFALSGFLVTRSYMNSGSTRSFLEKRVARIVPGFLVASFVGYVVLAPLVANGSPYDFFSSQRWSMTAAKTAALLQTGVEGVLEGNPVTLMHGTLWSIKYEFDCYLLIALVGCVGLLSRRVAGMTCLCILAVLLAGMALADRIPTINHGFLAFVVSSPSRWPTLFPFFFVGGAFFIFKDRIPLSRMAALFCAAVLATSIFIGGMYWAVLICGTYVLLFLGMTLRAEPKVLGRPVDLSYGVYLYGWPIAQVLLFASAQRLGPMTLFILSMCLTLPVAFVSWRYIEWPSLMLAARAEREWGNRARVSALPSHPNLFQQDCQMAM